MNHNEVIHQPSRAQRAKYDQIVEVVKSNPGISTGQISKIYYGEKGVPYGNRMTAMLLQLCTDNRLKYQEVNRYIAVEPTWKK